MEKTNTWNDFSCDVCDRRFPVKKWCCNCHIKMLEQAEELMKRNSVEVKKHGNTAKK